MASSTGPVALAEHVSGEGEQFIDVVVEVVLDEVRQRHHEPVGSDLRRQVAHVHQVALPRFRRIPNHGRNAQIHE
jgi:hypothetical protein